jgi:NAD(P)-dependent dehydrogenase (short-subunit alcohol dehydrogenase family)
LAAPGPKQHRLMPLAGSRMSLGPFHICVNSISSGAIVTGSFAKGGGASEADAANIVDRLAEFYATIHPIRHAGLPDGIANAAIFLASDQSSFITLATMALAMTRLNEASMTRL